MKRLLSVLFLALLLSSSVKADDPAGIKVVVLAKAGSSWDGSPLPAYPSTKPEITILHITIPAGATLSLHQHPVINAGVLLSGELTVIADGNKTLHLRKGDAIIELVGKWHYGKNTGKTPAVIVVFYAGGKGIPITIKK